MEPLVDWPIRVLGPVATNDHGRKRHLLCVFFVVVFFFFGGGG